MLALSHDIVSRAQRSTKRGEAERSGALQTRDRQGLGVLGGPGPAVQHGARGATAKSTEIPGAPCCTASGTQCLLRVWTAMSDALQSATVMPAQDFFARAAARLT